MNSEKSRCKLSIVIPTYNRSLLLSYTLDSLVAQNLDKDLFEVIIADDGSSDDTLLMLDRFKSSLNLKYVYQEDKGYRPGSARNLGISMSESEICLLIDSGVLLDEDCVSAHLRFHRDNPSSAAIGFVYGFEENDVLRDELESIISPTEVGRTINELEKHHNFSDVRNRHYVKYNDKIDTLPAPWLYFWTCHVSVLKDHLLRVNMFDPVYDGRWGVEDNDLGFRLHQYGVKICLHKAAKSVHYPHAKNKEERHKEGYLNCVYFNSKFQTLETQLFLDQYMDSNFFDINQAAIQIMEAKLENTSITSLKQ